MHAEGGKIAMQILHAGRYAYHPLAVAPSRIRSPITPFTPRELSTRGVEKQIRDFVRCAQLAREAGYDGVEIMGSEGYFINEFLVTHTNQRTDDGAATIAQRMRLPVEIVERTREAVGKDFIIIYRLSMIDLIPDGSSWEETVHAGQSDRGGRRHDHQYGHRLARSARPDHRDIGAARRIHLGDEEDETGGHDSAGHVQPHQPARHGGEVLADGCADMVSMARPLLADPEFVRKAREDRADEINVCIACNQACLDHTFANKMTSCLVNPRACHETELNYVKTTRSAGSPLSVRARPESLPPWCWPSVATRWTCTRRQPRSAAS